MEEEVRKRAIKANLDLFQDKIRFWEKHSISDGRHWTKTEINQLKAIEEYAEYYNKSETDETDSI